MPSVQTQIPLLYVIACGGLSDLFTVHINVLRLHSTLREGSPPGSLRSPGALRVATERASIKFHLICRRSAICEYFNWNRCYFRKIV